jgi:hypothetical protein
MSPRFPPILANNVNMIIFRAILFSILPLLMAVKVLRIRSVPLDRGPLKPLFYSQCFIAAPFALSVEISITLSQLHLHRSGALSAALFALSLGWYLLAEAWWFSDQVVVSRPRAFGSAAVTLLEGLAIMIVLLILVSLGLRTA